MAASVVEGCQPTAYAAAEFGKNIAVCGSYLLQGNGFTVLLKGFNGRLE